MASSVRNSPSNKGLERKLLKEEQEYIDASQEEANQRTRIQTLEAELALAEKRVGRQSLRSLLGHCVDP